MLMLYEKNIGQCYELNTRVQAQIVDVYDNGVSGVSVEVETEYGDTGTINLFDTELRFRKRIDNSEFRIMDGIICKSNREEYDICIQRVDKRKVMISVRESEDQSIISDAIIVLNKKQTLKKNNHFFPNVLNAIIAAPAISAVVIPKPKNPSTD